MLGRSLKLSGEACLVEKTSLPSAFDVTDTSSRLMASAITLRWASWLQNSGIIPDAQTTEDLLFCGQSLFSDKVYETLHSFKDSRAMLRSLGAYTPAAKRLHYGSQQQFNQYPQPYFGQASYSMKQHDSSKKQHKPHRRRPSGFSFQQIASS